MQVLKEKKHCPEQKPNIGADRSRDGESANDATIIKVNDEAPQSPGTFEFPGHIHALSVAHGLPSLMANDHLFLLFDCCS